LSERLAPVDHAPPGTVRQLAVNDEIIVAGPVLAQSNRLDEAILVAIAKTKSQAHLLAISARKQLNEPVTDVLVQRGDDRVAHSVAANLGAVFSDQGFDVLAERADADVALAETMVRRPDLPLPVYCALLARATDVVRERLLAATRSQAHAEICQAVDKASAHAADRTPVSRDYATALRNAVLAHSSGNLHEHDVLDHVRARRYEDTVAAISVLSSVPVKVVEQAIRGDCIETLLILCKTAGFKWPTLRAIIQYRLGRVRLSPQQLVDACNDFARLSSATAEKAVQFWRDRQTGAAS
jgi:uncharacterized protein (DUF2336 family)